MNWLTTLNVVLLVPAAILWTPLAVADDSPLRVVIDTDLSLGISGPGYDCTTPANCSDCTHVRDVDDAWAIPLLLTDSSIEVVAIVVSFGNAWCFDACNEDCDPAAPCESVDEMVQLARELVAWSGQDIPVFRGSICPFDPEGTTPPGLAELEDLLRKTGAATVLGIGCGADPAYLVRDLGATDELALLDQLVLEMGYWGEWFGEPSLTLQGHALGDANMLNDQQSIAWLLEQDELPPIEFIPFNAVRMGSVTPPLLDAMADSRGAASQRIASDSVAWMERWANAFDDAHMHLWDVVAASSLIDGAVFETAFTEPFVQSFTQGDQTFLTLQLGTSSESTGFTVKPTIVGYGPPCVSLWTPVGAGGSGADPTIATSTSIISHLAVRGIGRLDATTWCPGDLTGDGVVGIADLLLVVEAWGPCP